jgi:cell surface protein SprA
MRTLLGIRTMSLTYTSGQGQYLPGYMPGTKYLGMSKFNDILAPGVPFILGYNNESFFNKAARNGWITTDTLLSTPATLDNKHDISLRTMVEPFPSLRIDINADRRFTQTISSYYIADKDGNFPESRRNRILTGTYSISVISWGTAFEKISKDNEYESPTFEAFKKNLIIISERRAAERAEIDPTYNPDIDPVTGNPIEGPYKNGYGMTSREVMIPAFLAAYTKTDAHKVTLATFPSALKMMPNWRITFDGLTKFSFIQRIFRSLTLTHQYRSTYQIGSYMTNLNYAQDESGICDIRDHQNNFTQRYEINVVTLNEQFSPLINVDMNWKNNLTTRFEWKKSRTVSLNLTSNQIADARINELIVGLGYRFEDLRIELKTAGRQRALKSDLNLRLDFSIRDNKTLARKLVEDVNQPVVGSKVYTGGFTADYMLSDRFNLQIFADYTKNNPFVASTFPTSNLNIGFSLKFTLAQ